MTAQDRNEDTMMDDLRESMKKRNDGLCYHPAKGVTMVRSPITGKEMTKAEYEKSITRKGN